VVEIALYSYVSVLLLLVWRKWEQVACPNAGLFPLFSLGLKAFHCFHFASEHFVGFE
jgi:hypothetical protein